MTHAGEGKKAGAELDAKPYSCRRCSNSRPSRMKDGRRYCAPCAREQRKRSYNKLRDRIAERRRASMPWGKEKFRTYQRKWRIKSRYGITTEQYEQMRAAQNGVCLICNSEPVGRPLHIDHCHKTGKIRGLLCFRCNPGLAIFDDSPERLRRAADYLEGKRT